MLLKRSAGSEGDKVDVQKFFGYIGLFTLLGFWWLGKMMANVITFFLKLLVICISQGEIL